MIGLFHYLENQGPFHRIRAVQDAGKEKILHLRAGTGMKQDICHGAKVLIRNQVQKRGPRGAGYRRNRPLSASSPTWNTP